MIASWTGDSGDPAGALRLYQELLPDMEQVLGPRHHSTLATRINIAFRTGHSGDPAGAVRLFQAVLPDVEQVLGSRASQTLATRVNIARWTGDCGDWAGALRLSRDLLPDVEQVLGPRDPGTLALRGNIARWTDQCGDAAGALRLYQELLPDMEQVLGPRHPNTLITRSMIARGTGASGDPAGALRLSRDLLPDMEQVLGPRHPYTLAVCSMIAAKRRARPPSGEKDVRPVEYLYEPWSWTYYEGDGKTHKDINEIPIVKKTAKRIYYDNTSRWDQHDGVVTLGFISREEFETDTRCREVCPVDVAVTRCSRHRLAHAHCVHVDGSMAGESPIRAPPGALHQRMPGGRADGGMPRARLHLGALPAWARGWQLLSRVTSRPGQQVRHALVGPRWRLLRHPRSRRGIPVRPRTRKGAQAP